MADSTKADLEKEVHSLKVKLGKAEKRVAELEDATAPSGPFALPPEEDRVFGPDAVPLEQR